MKENKIEKVSQKVGALGYMRYVASDFRNMAMRFNQDSPFEKAITVSSLLLPAVGMSVICANPVMSAFVVSATASAIGTVVASYSYARYKKHNLMEQRINAVSAPALTKTKNNLKGAKKAFAVLTLAFSAACVASVGSGFYVGAKSLEAKHKFAFNAASEKQKTNVALVAKPKQFSM